MRRRVITFSFTIAVLISCSYHANAQEGSDLEARIQFDQGVLLYEEGRFDQAAVAFRRAYELKPSYKLLWNVAQVENELGNYSAALNAYTKYLADGGDEVSDERRQMVEKQLERLRFRVGELTIKCPVKGATVYINGKDRGTTPLDAPLYVNVGEHEIEVTKQGKRLHREVLAVAGRQKVTVDVEVAGEELPPTPVEPETEPEPEPEPEEPEEPSPTGPRIWTWVALGVGVAAGVTGGILGGKALSRKNSFMDECGDGQCVKSPDCGSGWLLITGIDEPTGREDDRDRIKTMSLTADILYGVAAAGVATGVVLFFIEPTWSGDEAEVTVAPTVSSDVAGVAIIGEF
ncbi:MAG: PEGA domain-containing protein [Deltaproteobacteria bacterium]|nr:PEGA domain-containing protein [Deltaproteobacteria bacterium]